MAECALPWPRSLPAQAADRRRHETDMAVDRRLVYAQRLFPSPPGPCPPFGERCPAGRMRVRARPHAPRDSRDASRRALTPARSRWERGQIEPELFPLPAALGRRRLRSSASARLRSTASGNRWTHPRATYGRWSPPPVAREMRACTRTIVCHQRHILVHGQRQESAPAPVQVGAEAQVGAVHVRMVVAAAFAGAPQPGVPFDRCSARTRRGLARRPVAAGEARFTGSGSPCGSPVPSCRRSRSHRPPAPGSAGG